LLAVVLAFLAALGGAAYLIVPGLLSGSRNEETPKHLAGLNASDKDHLNVPVVPKNDKPTNSATSGGKTAVPTVPQKGVVTNSLGMQLVLIPAGQFRMGSPPSEVGRQNQEGPQHEVTISHPFLLGVHEVTVANFRAFVEATGFVTYAETRRKG